MWLRLWVWRAMCQEVTVENRGLVFWNLSTKFVVWASWLAQSRQTCDTKIQVSPTDVRDEFILDRGGTADLVGVCGPRGGPVGSAREHAGWIGHAGCSGPPPPQAHTLDMLHQGRFYEPVISSSHSARVHIMHPCHATRTCSITSCARSDVENVTLAGRMAKRALPHTHTLSHIHTWCVPESLTQARLAASVPKPPPRRQKVVYEDDDGNTWEEAEDVDVTDAAPAFEINLVDQEMEYVEYDKVGGKDG